MIIGTTKDDGTYAATGSFGVFVERWDEILLTNRKAES